MEHQDLFQIQDILLVVVEVEFGKMHLDLELADLVVAELQQELMGAEQEEQLLQEQLILVVVEVED
jgi:hypothetical protein